MEVTLIEDMLTGIETVLYANNNIFTGEIESFNFTYLNKDLKNYSLTNAIDKNVLTQDKRDPLQSKIILGEELLDLDLAAIESMGAEFISTM